MNFQPSAVVLTLWTSGTRSGCQLVTRSSGRLAGPTCSGASTTTPSPSTWCARTPSWDMRWPVMPRYYNIKCFFTFSHHFDKINPNITHFRFPWRCLVWCSRFTTGLSTASAQTLAATLPLNSTRMNWRNPFRWEKKYILLEHVLYNSYFRQGQRIWELELHSGECWWSSSCPS